MLKETADAIKIIEELPDSFWDEKVGTWSTRPFSSRSRYTSGWSRTQREKYENVDDAVRIVKELCKKEPNQAHYRPLDYTKWRREERYIRNTWNSQRREAQKRTGVYSQLKEKKQKELSDKKNRFDFHKQESLVTIRELVSELLLYDRLLQEDTVSKKKIELIQRKAARLFHTQKAMLKAGRGTDKLK